MIYAALAWPLGPGLSYGPAPAPGPGPAVAKGDAVIGACNAAQKA